MTTRASDTEDDADAGMPPERALRFDRLFLWGALIAALLAVLFTFANKIGGFAVCYVASFLAGYEGIRSLSQRLRINGVARLLSMFTLFVPLVNLVPLIWFLTRAHAAVAQVDAAGAAQARSEARDRARERAAERAAASTAKAATATPPAKSAGITPPAKPAVSPGDASRAARAIACVKHVGALGSTADGERLRIKVSQPRVDLSDDDEPVVRATAGLFGVFYAVDEGEHLAYLNMRDLRAAGLTLDQLHASAVKNLAALVNAQPGLQLLPQGSFNGLTMGGHFEASLVLLDALWDDTLKAHAPNGAVVTVAARDICAFADARSADGIAELRRIAERVTKGGDHPLSPKLLVRRAGAWALFDKAAG